LEVRLATRPGTALTPWLPAVASSKYLIGG